jgi:hypothetical protein
MAITSTHLLCYANHHPIIQVEWTMSDWHE